MSLVYYFFGGHSVFTLEAVCFRCLPAAN